MLKFILDKPWVIVFAVILAIGGWKVIDDRKQPYVVRAAFDSAVSISSGLDVQADGVDIGKVVGVKYEDGKAIVRVGVTDKGVLPLRQGTTMRIRYGTTIGNGTRYVEVNPGPKTGRPITNNGIIQAKDTRSPVELDELFNTLDADTRKDVQNTFKRSARALRGHDENLNAGIKSAPGGVSAANDLIVDLLSDEPALKAIITQGDDVTKTLAAKQGSISDLLAVASRTFSTFGARSQAIQQSLDGFPSTLDQARKTLARTDSSLGKVDELLADVRPGAREIPSVAKTATGALTRLQDVAPVAVNTLQTVRDVAPRVTTMLNTGTPFVPKAEKALDTFTPMVGCLRPYAPDIVAMLQNWGSWSKNYDYKSHYGRVRVREGVTSLNGLLPNAELPHALGNKFVMPIPPGYNAGNPYFVPECGVTKDALDPTKDPEAVK